MVLVVDFGGQTAHLITRRLKQLGAQTKLILPQNALIEIKKHKPNGIIFSGGPASVYNPGAPTIDPKIFQTKIPILGICYGLQLTAHLLGGKVISGRKEYGPAELELRIKNKQSLPSNERNELSITESLPKHLRVWMSHGDEVVSMPKDFKVLGTSQGIKYAFVESKKRNIYGVQFHPEVEHTENGMRILKNFLSICHFEPKARNLKTESRDLSLIARDDMVKTIKDIVGHSFVIGAVSGGVDSTVAAALLGKAVPKQFFPVYVDNGLMREGNTDWVKKIFKKIGVKVDIVECEEEMLKKLKGISDPEQKRKIIGSFYIELFERELKTLKQLNYNIKFLMQGTIYSDVIESKGTENADEPGSLADKIKSHHNVGGLPSKMKLKLIEPLRKMYKDEVRDLGRKLGLPEEFIEKQVFPGPGYAVRIRGEVTKERLEKAKQADKIILEELDKAKILEKVFMSFPVLTGVSSTSVKGDERFFGEVIALRIIESKDVMTAAFAQIPYSVLQKISSRIVNEVPKISRVVYDITTKPPATMEWE